MIETTQKMSNLRLNSKFGEWVLTMEMNPKGEKEVMEMNMKAKMNEMIEDLVPVPYRNRNIERKTMAQSTAMAMIQIARKTSMDVLVPWIALKMKS
jgi:hypothetical protein